MRQRRKPPAHARSRGAGELDAVVVDDGVPTQDQSHDAVAQVVEELGDDDSEC